LVGPAFGFIHMYSVSPELIQAVVIPSLPETAPASAEDSLSAMLAVPSRRSAASVELSSTSLRCMLVGSVLSKAKYPGQRLTVTSARVCAAASVYGPLPHRGRRAIPARGRCPGAR